MGTKREKYFHIAFHRMGKQNHQLGTGLLGSFALVVTPESAY